MDIPSKIPSANIPPSEIYKVHILDSTEKIRQIIVFSGGLKNETNKAELFSESENVYINANDVTIRFSSDFLLHADDSIRIIKKKIINELGADNVAYDEIYMFSKITVKINMEQIYKILKTQTLTKEQFGQFIKNLDIPDAFIEKIDKTKPTYTYDDLLLLGIHNTDYAISIPIGQRFMEYSDFLFSANPFDIVNTTSNKFMISPENPLMGFENELLFNYGDILDKDIYVCLAKDVYNFASSMKIDETYITSLYYPFLFNKDIKTLAVLTEKTPQLLKENKKILSASSMQLYKTVDMFYKIYYNKSEPLPYIENGIQHFSLVIRSGIDISIPLEPIFKNLHATKQIPFIKYNPGNRRENMYRLYSEFISKTGQKIPELSESMILKLSKEIGKSKQISMYIIDTGFYIDFESDGSIFVRAHLKEPLPYEKWNELMIQQMTPIIDTLNGILQQTGISLLPIQSMADKHIEILNINYVISMQSDKIYSIKESKSCISSIFDIITDDLSKEVQMKYKRVANFKEMNAETELITRVLKLTNDYQQVAEALILNYKMTPEEALLRISDYVTNASELAGKILDNPGFYVKMHYPLNQKKVKIEIDNIISLDYLNVLNIYFDSILRIISNQTTFFKKEVCNAKPNKDSDKTQFANIISTTTAIQPKKTIQPLNFASFFNQDEDIESKSKQGESFLPEEEDEEEFIDKSPRVAEIEKPFLATKIPNIKSIVQSTSPIEEVGFNLGDYQEEETEQPQEQSGFEGEEYEEEPDEELGFEGEEYEEEPDEEVGFEGEEYEEEPDEELGFEGEEYEEEPDEETELPPREKGGKSLLVTGGIPTPDNEQPAETVNIDGMSLSNYFLNRLKEKDPKLFLTRKEGKYDSYAKKCAANIFRQPVILSDEEKAIIDKTNPESYKYAVKYGSEPDKQSWYICPRYWCLKTNSSISEADVKAGKCGNIIPEGSKKVPKGAYVYEFNSHTKEHINTKGEFIEHYPSFFKDSHPDGKCVPCCFKLQQNKQGEWEMGNKQKEEREQCTGNVKIDKPHQPIGNVYYIKSASIVPLEQNRWGFLPMSAQFFLKTDNSAATTKINSTMIRPNTPCLLRYGVEQVLNQSFLGCVAELYAYKQTENGKESKVPTVVELRKLMADSFNLDLFIQYHNGSLVSVFKPALVKIDEINIDLPEYLETQFYKSIDLAEESHRDFLVDTIAAYENFKRFLQDEKSKIDHTYIWDMIIGENPKFMKDGFNLVIMEMPNNDITDKIELLCPSNSYSQTLYDTKKETVLILKQGEFYEPIYVYEERKGIQKQKTFSEDKPLNPNQNPSQAQDQDQGQNTNLQNIVEILNLAQAATNQYCRPLPSRPQIYKFVQNIIASEIQRILTSIQYNVTTQIMNYQGKIVGLLVKQNESAITTYVPCLPSAVLNGIPIKYMDDDIWSDYNTTRDKLRKIKSDSNNQILCEPRMKVIEGKLIVGILTETNQFVQVSPPAEIVGYDGLEINDALETELEQDGLKLEKKGANYNVADKIITTSDTPDLKRIETIKKIALESNFFSIFRTTIRNLLNQYENRKIKKQILDTLDIPNKTYRQKLKIVDTLLRTMGENKIKFQDFELKDLLLFDEITGCSTQNCDEGGQKKYCFKEGDTCTMLIPSKHLISDKENNTIYYARIADELIRYKRIRLFMLESNFYLNITDTEYKINNNEFMVLQSIIGTDYFKGLVPFNSNQYIHNINYELAEPSITQTYSNELSLSEQQKMLSVVNAPSTSSPTQGSECIEKRIEIMGSNSNFWKKTFPISAEEIVFKNTVECSYSAILYIFQEYTKTPFTVNQIKDLLVDGYRKLVEFEYKIINILLQQQGKRQLMERVLSKSISLEQAIRSDEYYITDMDLWVLAKDANLPIILFSGTKLVQLSAGLEESVNWIFIGRNKSLPDPLYFMNTSLYFIRTPTAKLSPNIPPKYNVLERPFLYTELKTFQMMLNEAIMPDNLKYKQNMQTLEQYLQSIIIIPNLRKGK